MGTLGVSSEGGVGGSVCVEEGTLEAAMATKGAPQGQGLAVSEVGGWARFGESGWVWGSVSAAWAEPFFSQVSILINGDKIMAHWSWTRRLLVSGGAYAAYRAYRKQREEETAPAFVVEVDLTALRLTERPLNTAERVRALLTGAEPTAKVMLLRDAAAAIRGAANDPKVAGIVARCGNEPASLAQAQELRDAILSFRSAKKGGKEGGTTVAYADEFSGSLDYYLASSCGEVYQLPGATLSLPGLRAQLPFVAGFLARWGLRVERVAVGEFKNGLDGLTETQASSSTLKATTRLLRSSFEQLLGGIAEARALSERQVRWAAVCDGVCDGV